MLEIMKLNASAFTVILTLILVITSVMETKSDIGNREILVGASARALGMGSAYTAGPAGSDSFYWNPSSLGFLSGMEVSVVGLPYAENATNREGAFSIGLSPLDLGISTNKIGNISLGSWIDGWGEDRIRNRLTLLGYGYSFGKSVAAGANIRHHRRSRGANTHLGWSYDFGIQVSRKLNRLGNRIAFGLSFEDFDGRLYRDRQLIQDLPLVVRFGTAYHFDRGTVLSSDFTLHNDDQLEWKDRFRAHFGAEQWMFNRRFGIRFGYTAITNNETFTEGEWSGGFSLRSDLGRLDYAFLNGDMLEKGSHWIAATFRWNRIPHTIPAARPEPPAPLLMPTTPPPPPKTIHPVRTLNEDEIDFSVSDGVISPNGDGIKDISSFSLTVPDDVKWTLEIHDERGEIVRRYSGTGLRQEALMWNGEDDAGNLVKDGLYTAQFTVLDLRDYKYLQRGATVQVDTIPTEFEIHAEPLAIEPSADMNTTESSAEARGTKAPTVHIQTQDLNQIVRWELKIVKKEGDAINTINGDGTPSGTIVWHNWDGSQLLADSEADYNFEMTVYDIAGNPSSKATPLRLIDLTPMKLPGDEDAVPKEELTVEGESPRQDKAVEQKLEDSEVVLTLPGVAFDTGSYEIGDDYWEVLEKVANVIRTYPAVQVRIEGHTDSIGDADYNLKLSRQRADAVKDYLVREFGVAWSRLKTVGYGEEKPIVDNDVDSIRHKNRRVEVVLSISGSHAQDTDMISDITNRVNETSSEMSKLNHRWAVRLRENRQGKWTLIVSSFKARESAALLVENLKTLDISNYIHFSRVVIKSQPWYRVTVGRFKERADAEEFAEQLRESQGIEPIVISLE